MKAIRDSVTGRSWTSQRELMDFIVATHHGYLRLAIPALERMMGQVATQGSLPAKVIGDLERRFIAVADILDTHLARQERLVFPKINHLREPVGETAWISQSEQRLDELIEREATDNSEVIDMMNRIHDEFEQIAPEQRRPLVAQMIDDLEELRNNLVAHARLESDLLFPTVIEDYRGRRLAV